jgi:hypothetical protein
MCPRHHSPGVVDRTGASGDGPKGEGTRCALVTIPQACGLGRNGPPEAVLSLHDPLAQFPFSKDQVFQHG